jgi:hypothetical protein
MDAAPTATNPVPTHEIPNETDHTLSTSSLVMSEEVLEPSSFKTSDQNGTKILSSAAPSTTAMASTTAPDRKQQEQDPILILLDIADNASVNSSSTNGYATSMTSSIGSHSNMSRSYRHYNTFENRFHHRIPTSNRTNSSNHHNVNSTTNSVQSGTSTTTSTSYNSNFQGTITTNNTVIDSYSQSKHHNHRRHQYETDNDSTTSSNTGYISTLSNGHISISGSVASV